MHALFPHWWKAGRLSCLWLVLLCLPARAASGDAKFAALAQEIIENTFAYQPTNATWLGIHKYDHRLEDYSAEAVARQLRALRAFDERLGAIDPGSLSEEEQLDREHLLHAVQSDILELAVLKPLATKPDSYSSGLGQTAYIMVKRAFAPAEERLRLLIAREKAMPEALAEARKNLVNPPRILTEIALEQIDGNINFFQTSVPQAFAGVKDAALLKEFDEANNAVITALEAYKSWLKKDLLPRSNGEFALGADIYRKKLWADEMIDTPLDALLSIAEADLKRNQGAFAAAARLIDPKLSPREVLSSLESNHPPAEKLLEVTQSGLDLMAKFLADRGIVSIPTAAPARVEETPPFMRATLSAAMDTPGPFETVATEAYYSMTLPDPVSKPEEQAEFMKQWYYAAISNVSVHEVWPGHYLQFLNAKSYPSDVRRVFGASSNVEGWAHYSEQMMIDEGFHADDPRYRLAQLQDALLRDVRFIVGIRMHTQGMTVTEARDLFERDAFQSRPTAEQEAKRGASDPTYGYYTMGKLMILKLREDYRAKVGEKFTLRNFHDRFIALGPLPVPLIRRAMLGEAGRPF